MRKLLHQALPLLALLAAFVLPSFAHAANLTISPGSGSYGYGKTFSLAVNVSSSDQAMNAVSGALSFPPDKLQVVSLSKTGSILTLWVQEPSYSNSSGLVNFEGVVPNPGFQGSNGRIINVNFRVVGQGEAAIRFDSASVLANDGSGTNILNNFNSAIFTLISAGNISPPAVNTADLTHPEGLAIKELPSADATDPRPAFSFVPTNFVSGVDHYVVQIDTAEPVTWQDDGKGIYTTVALGPGIHTLVAKGFDGSGSFATASIDFSIAGIESPVIAFYTDQISGSASVVVRGTAPKDDNVKLTLAKAGSDPITVTVGADESGNFSAAFQGNKLENGVYKLTAISLDSRGAQSVPTAPKTVLVNAGWFESLLASLTSFLSLIIPVLALVFLLAFLVLFGFHKVHEMKRKMNRELQGIEHMVNKAFALLKEDIEDSIHLLERTKNRRKLTEEETEIIARFRRNLSDAEKVIHKQVQDIEREIGE